MASDLQLSASLTPPGSASGVSDMSFSRNCGSSGTSAYPWGTWEDLLLASAVSRHGVNNWTSVSCELQARAFVVPPSLFSAEACKVRFWILDGRFSSCKNGNIRDGKIPWFEEVRKLRVAQLKRELEHYNGSIGLLEKKLKRLKAGNIGVESVACRDHHKQDDLISLVAQEEASCSQISGDPNGGMNSRSSLAPDLRQSSHSTSSTAVAGGGDVPETNSLSGLNESVTVKIADRNFSCCTAALDKSPHRRHCGNIIDQDSLASLDQNSNLEVNNKQPRSEIGLRIENEIDIRETQDADHESKDIALSFKVENHLLELEQSHEAVVVTEKQVCDSCNGELGSLGCSLDVSHSLSGLSELDTLVHHDTTCSATELELGLDPSRERVGLNNPVADVDKTQSVKCMEELQNSTTKLVDNVVMDALPNASAMELLRIAYADGTPVSTPENTEYQPIEPVRSEEPEMSGTEGGVCPSLSRLCSCEPELSPGMKAELPCKEHLGYKMEVERTIRSQLPISECLRDSKEGLQERSDLLSSFLPEHSAEERAHQVLGMHEVQRSLSYLSDFSNSELENTLERAKTGQLQERVGNYTIAPKRICISVSNAGSKSLNVVEGDCSLVDVSHGFKPRKGRGSDNADCLGDLAEDSCEIAKDGRHMEMKNDVLCSETLLSNVDSLPKIESNGNTPSKPMLHMVKKNVHPPRVIDLQDRGQSHSCARNLNIEMNRKCCSPPTCTLGEIRVLDDGIRHGCDSKLVHDQMLNPMHCKLNDRSQDMNFSSEPTKREQESGPRSGVHDSPTVELPLSGIKAGTNTSKKQAILEEGPKPLLKPKYSRREVSGCSHKIKHRADDDSIEEDGLLVDLIKLKDSDITTLRKRKLLGRGGTNVNKGSSKKPLVQGILGEVAVHKELKFSRFDEEVGNKTSLGATQNKSSSKQKGLDHRSGDNSKQAAFSSNNSLLKSHPKYRSKESAIGLFPSRRSRHNVRSLESQAEEPEKIKREADNSIQKFEAALVLESAVNADGELEDSSVHPRISTGGLRANDGFLPDLLVLLEYLRKISGHRFAPLFKMQSENDPRYRALVKRHMDLNIVRNKLEDGRYSESLEFFRDMMLIFSNALVFYPRESQEYCAAQALRENLIRRMDRCSKAECLSEILDSSQGNEATTLTVSNTSLSEISSDGKVQASVKSSCGLMIEDFAADSTGDATSAATIAVQDLGSKETALLKDSENGMKNEVNPVSSRLITKTKLARSKPLQIEVEKSGGEKTLRQSAHRFSTLSLRKESMTLNLALRKPLQTLPCASREYITKRGPSDKIRHSNDGYDMPVCISKEREDSQKGLHGVRSSRRAQQAKQSRSQEMPSYFKQSHKRART